MKLKPYGNCTHALDIIPGSPFCPFSPVLPSLPSLPGTPEFPSAPGVPPGPSLPGGPGAPGTLHRRRGAPFSSCPVTQWHRHTAPIKAHIFTSAQSNNKDTVRKTWDENNLQRLPGYSSPNHRQCYLSGYKGPECRNVSSNLLQPS